MNCENCDQKLCSGNCLRMTKEENMNFNELESKVIEWAKARQIIQNSTSETQLFKAFSEMGELSDALIKHDEAGISDAIGDVLVCLINFCEIRGISITQCLQGAYNEIKGRKGTLLPNGCFVKD